MSMSIKVSDLKGALKKVSGVVKPKGVLETARFVVFDTAKGILWGDDGSTAVAVKLPQIKTEGEPFALDGSKLAQVVNGFDPDKEMKITLKATTAQVSCGRSRFSIARLTDEKLPSLPKLDGFSTFTFRREALATALADTAPFAATKDMGMATLCGVYVEASSEGVKLTATNRHTLSHVEIKPAKAQGDERHLILKVESVKVALSIMDGEWVHLMMDGAGWAINDGATTLIGRAISGKFPDYTRLLAGIERQKSEQVVVNIEALRKSISRLKGFAEQDGIVIEARDGLLTLTARSSGGEVAGEDVIEAPAKLEMPVGVNIRYLDMIASTFHGDRLELKLPQDGQGVLATQEKREEMSKVQLVSPIRL